MYTHDFNILCEVESVHSEGQAEIWWGLAIVNIGEGQEAMARVTKGSAGDGSLRTSGATGWFICDLSPRRPRTGMGKTETNPRLGILGPIEGPGGGKLKIGEREWKKQCTTT